VAAGWPVAVLAAPPLNGDGEQKSPLETWNGLVALVLPLIVGLFIQKGWTKGTQTAVMVGCALVTALVGQYLTDGFHGGEWQDPMMTVMKVVGLTEIAYRTIWQAIPLPQLIESKTGGDSFNVQNPFGIKDVKDAQTGKTVRQTG